MSNRRFEMYQYRQVLVRMRQGDSDREIARSRLMGRKKIAQLRVIAQERGWLAPEAALPEDAVLVTLFPRREELPSQCVSSLEPWRTPIAAWQAEGILQASPRISKEQITLVSKSMSSGLSSMKLPKSAWLSPAGEHKYKGRPPDLLLRADS